MKRRSGALSPLLAILIGLIITIIAGVILAQIYLNYAGIISMRPAALVEYADLIEGGGRDVLVINLKNVGNVPITDVHVKAGGGASLTCSVVYAGRTVMGGDNPVRPGSMVSITCVGSFTNSPGDAMTAILDVGFSDGSRQNYAVQVRARIA